MQGVVAQATSASDHCYNAHKDYYFYLIVKRQAHVHVCWAFNECTLSCRLLLTWLFGVGSCHPFTTSTRKSGCLTPSPVHMSPRELDPTPLWTSTCRRHEIHIGPNSLETASTMTFRT